MFGTLFLFELKKRVGMLSTYVYAALFFSLGLIAMLAAGGAFSGVSVGAGTEKVAANAPATVHGILVAVSAFGVIVTAAVFGQALHQDVETGAYALFFTLPVRRSSYLGGRFAGALAFMTAVFAFAAAGMAAGCLRALVAPEHFGPWRAATFVWPVLTSILPNVFFCGAIFFALAALTRKMVPVYVGAVVLAVGYIIALQLINHVENKTLAGMLDPFGLVAQSVFTQYWSIAEQNARLVPLEGVVLWNRLLWLGVGALFAWLGARRFRFAHLAEGGGRGPAPVETTMAVDVPVTPADPSASLAVFAQMAWLQFKETVKSVYFGVIVLAGILFIVLATQLTASLFGTTVWPVTYMVLEAPAASFQIFILIILTFYAGELVWRERDAQTSQIIDALPLPGWMLWATKLVALVGIQVVLLCVMMAAGLAIQTVKGYHHYELGLYAEMLFGLRLPRLIFLCVVAMAVQSTVHNKYVGHALMIAFYLSGFLYDRLGIQHHLLEYPSPLRYSDMNGYGHSLGPYFSFVAYWLSIGLLLVGVTHLAWVRGEHGSLRERLHTAQARFRGPARAWAGVAVALVALTGGWVFYNTNVLNRYVTPRMEEQKQAEYEKAYRSIAAEPQPRVAAVQVTFELEPDAQNLAARGHYELENRTGKPVPRVFVNVPDDELIHQLAVAGVTSPARTDTRLGVYTFDLPTPLAPGARASLDFDLAFVSRGFKNDGRTTVVVPNGTFVHDDILPHVGYLEHQELDEDNVRAKYGLAPKERMADLDDPKARERNYVTADGDWVDMDVTIGTSPDQLAVAPGALEREWTDGGKRWFRYRTRHKVLDFLAIVSGRYAVKTDRWNDVELEIDYHPTHTWDLAAMMRGLKESLAYCSEAFGPFQHQKLRIIEFPRYYTYAQSLPAMIPYSESIGFIARVDPSDKEDVDYPFYITAHETAHQWWAHQVVGANAQGCTVLSETLAQYSALMVMKKSFGPRKMKRFLAYELDRYLVGRATERKKEVPLERVENQPYIHYEKGSLVMYALQEAIGEERVNAALRAFVARFKDQGPPYPTARDLLAELDKVTPEDRKFLLHDFFETITLYDNRAVSATYREEGKGRYRVKLAVKAKQVQADELGAQKDVPVREYVDIGVLDDNDEPMLLENHLLDASEKTFELVVDKLPVKAGIDPLNALIDRVPDDNVIKVTAE